MSHHKEWARFVSRRRSKLADEYPCAAPTHRRRCPKHTTRIGPITRICKACREEFYERLAVEYLNTNRRTTNMASPGQAQTLRLLKPPQHNPTEDDSPAPELQPWTTGAAIAGQLELELDMSEQAVDQLREAVETSNAA